MNKQVVSFLSLFSLVLVLSIYYVMIPASRENIKNVDNQISSNNEELTIDNASNLFFTTLQENRKTRHDEVKNTQIDILASDQYTNQQKLEARNKLTHEELLETTEKGLESALNELAFNDIFVEKLDNYFYVTAYDKTLKSDDDILKVVAISDIYNNYLSSHDVGVLANCKPIVYFVSF